MEVKILGRIRKLLEGVDVAASSDEESVTLTPQLEMLVANSAAPWREIVRMGRAFHTGTTTPVAAVTAIPSTAHGFSLYNNAPDGGRSLVIDWVAASGAAKTAAAGQQQLLGLVGQVREAAPTDAGLAIKKANGLGSGTNDTTARTVLSATALPATTGVAGNWVPLGPSFGSPGAAATPGHGAWHPIDGRFIIPPGRYFSLHVLADVVGSTYQLFVGWHESTLQLG